MECKACERERYRKENPKAMMTMVCYPHTCEKAKPMQKSMGIKFKDTKPQIWNEEWIVNLKKIDEDIC